MYFVLSSETILQAPIQLLTFFYSCKTEANCNEPL